MTPREWIIGDDGCWSVPIADEVILQSANVQTIGYGRFGRVRVIEFEAYARAMKALEYVKTCYLTPNVKEEIDRILKG